MDDTSVAPAAECLWLVIGVKRGVVPLLKAES